MLNWTIAVRARIQKTNWQKYNKQTKSDRHEAILDHCSHQDSSIYTLYAAKGRYAWHV